MSDTLNTLIAEAREYAERRMRDNDPAYYGRDLAGEHIIALADALEALRPGTPTELWSPNLTQTVASTSTNEFGIPSRTLVAERERIAKFIDGFVVSAVRSEVIGGNFGTDLVAALYEFHYLMDAADVWDAGWRAGVYDEHHNLDNTPNPYRGGTT